MLTQHNGSLTDFVLRVFHWPALASIQPALQGRAMDTEKDT
jgi:hypothetical protein